MNPEPRPSKDCDACNDYEKQGYKECYCACHRVGNYMVGFHHHFNYIEKDYEVKAEKVLKWPPN